MTVRKLISILSATLLLCGNAPGPAPAPESAPTPAHIPQTWQDTWRSFGVDPYMAESVVWPEYERYDSFRDFFETAVVYMAGGESPGAPDMSIGIFQMKPSFVVTLERAWQRSGLQGPCELDFDTSGTVQAYHDRINRLRQEEWPVIYLAMFLKLLYYSYGSFDSDGNKTQEGIDTLPLEEQVLLASNAYNRGCKWFDAGQGDPDLLRVGIDRETFPRVLIPSPGKLQHSYAVLSLEHYKLISGME